MAPAEQPRNARQRAVDRLRARLQRIDLPRLWMAVLVTLSATAGLFASWAMLDQGLHSMAARYPLAAAIAYAVFLLLLWAWLRLRGDHLGDLNLPHDSPTSSDSDSATAAQGSGGSSGGGGSGGSGGVADSIGMADELLIPVAVLIGALALLLSAAWVVYSAPTLLAELLLDGALAGALYRRGRRLQRQHWLHTALRHTALPALLCAGALAAVGWAVQTLAPGAHSLGEAFAASEHRTEPAQR